MGWFQPGGAGTAIHCYDDNNATNHTAGQPHTWLECNTAFPVDFPRLQSAAGAFFSATQRQYLPAVVVSVGHPAGGNTNLTSLVDASNSDIFCVGARLVFSIPNAATTTFIMGTQIGAGELMTGKNGGSIHQTATLTFRGTVGLYGTQIHSTIQMQFLNASSNYQELAGCQAQGSGFVLGNASSGPLRLWNNNFAGLGAGATISTANVAEGAGNVLGVTAPTHFFQSGGSNIILGSLKLSGAPTIADMRITGGGNWQLNNVQWSDTVGKPRILFSLHLTLINSIKDNRLFDTKVVDLNGNPITGIPVYVTSDADGFLLETTTQPDGNIVFTWAPSNAQNVLIVRDYYSDVVGNPLVRDRVITVEVNGFSSSSPPNPNYKTKVISFEWPGRDRFGTAYVVDGGSFNTIFKMPIQLDPGTPSRDPLWTECEVAP